MRYKQNGYLYKDEPLQIITINVSVLQLKMIGKLIEEGIFASRSEGMRMMLAEWLPQKLQEMKDMKDYLHLEVQEDDEYIRIPNGDGTYEELKKVRRLE